MVLRCAYFPREMRVVSQNPTVVSQVSIPGKFPVRVVTTCPTRSGGPPIRLETAFRSGFAAFRADRSPPIGRVSLPLPTLPTPTPLRQLWGIGNGPTGCRWRMDRSIPSQTPPLVEG